MIINIVIKNIPNQIEKKLISLINFKPYKCYNEISKNELLKFWCNTNRNKL
jgi:outer membrane receptor for Fe3+-dicitrate